MSDAGETTRHPSSRRNRGCAVAVSVALMLGSGFVTVPLGMLAVMFTADCNDADDRLICTEVGGNLLFLGPIAGLIVGAVLSLVGAFMAGRRGHGLAPWLLAAWGVWVVGSGLPFVLTEQEQSLESMEREDAMYEAQDARERAEAIAEYRARPSFEEADARLAALRSEVDAELGPGVVLPWAPMEREDSGDAGCEEPGQSLWLEAELRGTWQHRWPAVTDAVTQVARRHQMSNDSGGISDSRERFFVDTDGTRVSARINDASASVVLYSDCRLTGADKANLPR